MNIRADRPSPAHGGTEPAPERFSVCGVRVDAVGPRQTLSILESWIARRHRSYVVLTGAHGIVLMQRDEELRRINNDAGLVTPDGMPVVWIGRGRGHRSTQKVSSGIMLEAMAFGVSRGFRHFLYGGQEGVAQRLEARLSKRFPGIRIVGSHSPPFRELDEGEVEQTANLINAASPDIVWVGLGCPKQERWMARFRPLLQAPVLIGVGAAFDFFSGEKPPAPAWLQRSGFEWLFRLASEPRRLWPRYSRVVPAFTYYVARDAARALVRRRRDDTDHPGGERMA